VRKRWTPCKHSSSRVSAGSLGGQLAITLSEFETVIPPDPKTLASLRRALEGWLDQEGVPEPARADEVLAAHEAAAKAIEHAKSTEPVIVRAQIVPEEAVVLEVRSPGNWTTQALSQGVKLLASIPSKLEVERADRNTALRAVVPL
jgi:hypothetical protein